MAEVSKEHRRVAVLTTGPLAGDSRAWRVAVAAHEAGYRVTLIGCGPTAVVPDGVAVRYVDVPDTLRTHRERRPHPGLRWPLAYRSAEAHAHRTAGIAARRALLATRAAELDVVHRAVPLRALARCAHVFAGARCAVRAGWTRLRAAQHLAAVRSRRRPSARLDDLAAETARLLLGRRAWRRLDPGLLDEETAFGPVLDTVRPHLVHALGPRALALGIRAALRAEGSGHRVEVVWDAPPRIPAETRRGQVAADALLRMFAREADGVVTVGNRLAAQLRAEYGLPALPVVARNAPPLPGRPASAASTAPAGPGGSGASFSVAEAPARPVRRGDVRVIPGPGSLPGPGSVPVSAPAAAVASASATAVGSAVGSAAVLRSGTVSGVGTGLVLGSGSRITSRKAAARTARETGVRARCGLGAETPLLVHVGPVTPDRGADTVVEALPKLYDLHAAFVVPDPEDDPNMAELRDRAAQLGVHGRLHVLPYVPVDQVSGFLASADIGVLPVHQLSHHQMVLATRYYEYAHARLPVVVSDVRAMAAATLGTGNGEVFRARDTADFVRAVGAVLTNPRRYRKAYERPDLLREWSWQTESAPLLDLYSRLLGPHR
ncbi:glycosyltransferase [Actinacidiphila yeochonensis]|uniref:glycosyltransferase n=1 Tax=Actinacidiphila yeochonensis TaxID=89050 RepID=UPI00055B2F49|nr:glycosyltransferase [Actinacidiphila yeochonensis]